MLTALSGANHGALTGGIGRILEHGSELFVFQARFFPFVRVVEILSALVLQLGGGVREFAAQILVQTRKCDGCIFRFIGERKFVIESLVVLDSKSEFAGGFIGASTNEQKSGLGGCGRIGGENLEAL